MIPKNKTKNNMKNKKDEALDKEMHFFLLNLSNFSFDIF
jgi:hypothetical protein